MKRGVKVTIAVGDKTAKNSAQQTSMERLSSGFKINSAKDDAAGLQISNRLNVQSRGLALLYFSVAADYTDNTLFTALLISASLAANGRVKDTY